mmetsp:Transcript_3308/g.6896  ORF Transcript_3308/g.6896 Transcript_3308/m.6896 type:complete len:266 (-) Transcript_3308:4-801(-)
MTLLPKKNRSNTNARTVSTPVTSRNRRNVAQWKEQIRSACLVRAKQSRQSMKRPLHQEFTNQKFDDDSSEPMITTTLTSPRDFLEDELRQRRVIVQSPMKDNDKSEDVEMLESSTDQEEEEAYTMTEDEFIELLEEIEQDWNIEQLEEQLLLEEEMVQDQVASYEHLSQEARQRGPSRSVLCPLCQSDIQHPNSRGILLCTGSESLSCPFHLSRITPDELRERIDSARRTHADFCSSESLTFSNPNPSTLTASCHACEMRMMLFG